MFESLQTEPPVWRGTSTQEGWEAESTGWGALKSLRGMIWGAVWTSGAGRNLQGSTEITPGLKEDHALLSFVPSFSKWRTVFVPHKSGPGLRY